MKSSMMILGWVSVLVALAILGMGGAPIAEYFELPYLVTALKWLSWISVAILAVATTLIGGLGFYHGILTLLGKTPGTVRQPKTFEPLPATPRVHVDRETPSDSADTHDARSVA